MSTICSNIMVTMEDTSDWTTPRIRTMIHTLHEAIQKLFKTIV